MEHKGKGGKIGPKTHKFARQQASQNMFQFLEADEGSTEIDKEKEGNPVEEEKAEDSEQIQENKKQFFFIMSNVEHEMDHEMTQSEMEMEDHELQEILEKENLDLEGFLNQGTKEGLDFLPTEEFNRVQQLFLWKTQTKGVERIRHKYRQGNEGVKMMKNIAGLAPGIPGKKRSRKKQNELLMECGKLMIGSGKMKDLSSYSFTSL